MLVFAALFSFIRDRNSIYVFSGVAGPREPTRIPKLDPTPWSRYANGTESRLAVLLTDTSGAWLALSHGLRSIGVPFLITTDYQQALKHSTVLVYPTVSGNLLPAEALKALAAVPRQGGTLIGFNGVGVHVEGGAEHWTIHLDIPELMVGLTLQVPDNFQFEASRPADVIVTQNQERVLVHKAAGKVELTNFQGKEPTGQQRMRNVGCVHTWTSAPECIL